MKSATRRHHWPQRKSATTIYQFTDRLHDGHMARVPAHQITATVSAWLAELGAHSPLVDDLARAVRGGDWPAAYALADCLSIEVAVAAPDSQLEGTIADHEGDFRHYPRSIRPQQDRGNTR